MTFCQRLDSEFPPGWDRWAEVSRCCYVARVCGRFTVTAPPEVLAEVLGVDPLPELPPRYNVAPTQSVLIVRRVAEGKRVAELARWGVSKKHPVINARQETVFEKFRSAVTRKRCLVPADGFLEWQKESRQPMHIRFKDARPFAMAGIFETSRDAAGNEQNACLVLTTRPNAVVASLHDRMPVILSPEDHALWLDPAIRTREPLEHLLLPFPESDLVAIPVSRRVNNVVHDDASCLAPLPPEGVNAPIQRQLGFDFEG